MAMACPICKTIKDILTLSERRQEPLFREEDVIRFIPELLGFDTRDPAWHRPGKTRDQIGPVLGTHWLAQGALEKMKPNQKRKSTAAGKKRRKMMSKNLKAVNVRARKKNGDLKKGWNQSRIMKAAQKMTKRDCK